MAVHSFEGGGTPLWRPADLNTDYTIASSREAPQTCRSRERQQAK
jgi:hypothetical protein